MKAYYTNKLDEISYKYSSNRFASELKVVDLEQIPLRGACFPVSLRCGVKDGVRPPDRRADRFDGFFQIRVRPVWHHYDMICNGSKLPDRALYLEDAREHRRIESVDIMHLCFCHLDFNSTLIFWASL